MEGIVEEAARTGRVAVEQAYVAHLPKTLTHGPIAARLRHLKLWYCMLADDALPPLSGPPLHPPASTGDGDGREGLDGECRSAAGDGLQQSGLGASLLSLHLGSNLLTRVPQGLDRLVHLRELILDGNKLSAIPPSLFQLRKLSVLVLSYNHLTSLPTGFWGAFPELTYLSLHHNRLASIGADIYELAPQIEVLYLHYNMITHIEPPSPSHAANFDGLRSLSLSHNQLLSLPSGFVQKLTGLKLLFLENNNIESLPDSICNLSELELLRVDNNRLARLPDHISRMIKLIALDCDNNRIEGSPADLIGPRHDKLRIVRAKGNPLCLDQFTQPDDTSPYLRIYVDGEMAGRLGLSVPRYLRSVATPEQNAQLPELEFSELRSEGNDSVTQMHVYRQWDAGTCGYHALKNAVIGVLAFLHRSEAEELSEPILRLACSPPHFWTPFFHWQDLLLEKGRSVRTKAQARARKYDTVWAEVSIKHGIMERLYIDFLIKRDPFLREIGTDHFLIISDLDYISSDPFDVPTIIEFDSRIALEKSVKAFVIGVSKSHFITVVGYIDRSGSKRFIVMNSSDYEDPATAPSVIRDLDELHAESNQGRERSVEPNVRLIIDCLTGRDNFRSFYLRRIWEGFVHQSLLALLDWETNQIDESKLEDWHLSASSFFSSFFSKLTLLGPQHATEQMKAGVRAYCKKLSAHPQTRALLLSILEDLSESVAGVFGSDAPSKLCSPPDPKWPASM